MTPDDIKRTARMLGFRRVPDRGGPRGDTCAEFGEWLEDGSHGDMAWMGRDPRQRGDPRLVLDGCRSVICLALNYYPGGSPDARGTGYRIARYAWNDDYHDIIRGKLRAFDELLQQAGGAQRTFTDTGPVLERDFASDSGLGWNGKSTVQIHRTLGTWFFLAEILTTLGLEPDTPMGRPLREMRPLHARVPHRGDHRAAPPRRAKMHILSHHRAQRPDPAGVPRRPSATAFTVAMTVWPPVRGTATRNCPMSCVSTPGNDLFRHSLRDFLALDDVGSARYLPNLRSSGSSARGSCGMFAWRLETPAHQKNLPALEKPHSIRNH